jgi:hypothetical protein
MRRGATTRTKPEASTAGSAVVGGYLRDLGLTSRRSAINEPGPDELRYLTFDDAEALNIAVRRWTGGGEPVARIVRPRRRRPSAPRSGIATPGDGGRPRRHLHDGLPDDEAAGRRTKALAMRCGSPPLAVGRTEVTFDEWAACVAEAAVTTRTAAGRRRLGTRGTRPVINVSWEDARAYADWLSLKTGRAYRLPSEAEWEYAARAGTTTPYGTGATLDAEDANVDGEKTVPVASYPANGFGLLDMHGNDWDWVADCYADSIAVRRGRSAVSPPDATGAVRGAGWNTTAPENMQTAWLRRPQSSRDSPLPRRQALGSGEARGAQTRRRTAISCRRGGRRRRRGRGRCSRAR